MDHSSDECLLLSHFIAPGSIFLIHVLDQSKSLILSSVAMVILFELKVWILAKWFTTWVFSFESRIQKLKCYFLQHFSFCLPSYISPHTCVYSLILEWITTTLSCCALLCVWVLALSQDESLNSFLVILPREDVLKKRRKPTLSLLNFPSSPFKGSETPHCKK